MMLQEDISSLQKRISNETQDIFKQKKPCEHPDKTDILSKKYEHTFFVQYIEGTGLPEPLHSNVTGPPLRACRFPDVGVARTLGGTRRRKK